MSDDDLDQLLDEVENKFCRNVSVTCSARGNLGGNEKSSKHNDGERKHSDTKSEQPISSVSEDIDALLEEFLEDDYNDSIKSKTGPFSTEPRGEKKLPVHSGGRKSCDQLRCLSCDFWVLMFDDSEWEASCDYLFFRNNMPDRQQLKTKLRKRKGLRAYACQCSWISTSETTDLRNQPQLRWVCGKHQD